MNLLELQRRMSQDVMRPLTPDFAMQAMTEQGLPSDEIAASYIKPNSFLTSFERLEIYNPTARPIRRSIGIPERRSSGAASTSGRRFTFFSLFLCGLNCVTLRRRRGKLWSIPSPAGPARYSAGWGIRHPPLSRTIKLNARRCCNLISCPSSNSRDLPPSTGGISGVQIPIMASPSHVWNHLCVPTMYTRPTYHWPTARGQSTGDCACRPNRQATEL